MQLLFLPDLLLFCAVCAYKTAVEYDDITLYGVSDGGGWFHMLPPDRMHLFHQGLFRHLIKWIFELLELWRGYCRSGKVSLQKQQQSHAKQAKKQRKHKSNGEGSGTSSANSTSSGSDGGGGGGDGGFSSEDEYTASGSKRSSRSRPRQRRTCKCCVHAGAATVDVDAAFMSMNTCASTPHTRFHYVSGISESSFINNKHVRSALEQLQVVLGSSTHFLPISVLTRSGLIRYHAHSNAGLI
jgi:hypothetical protein